MASVLRSSNRAKQKGVKSIVHGSPKVGKTRLVITCPAPVILSSENGLLSIRQHNLPVYDMPTNAAKKEAMNWVKTSAEARQFQTIFWDSASESGRIALRESNKKDARQAYGEMQEEIENDIRTLCSLDGPNVVVIFQSEFYKDEALGTAVHIPTLPGQSLKQQLAYMPDEVFFVYRATNPADGKEYPYIRTQPDFRTVAGDRSGALAAVEPADLGAIFRKIAAS